MGDSAAKSTIYHLKSAIRMMDFWKTISERHCVRRFDATREVSDVQVSKLLQAAILAPSAGNLQPWFFYVVRDAKLRQDLAVAAGAQGFVAQAPVVIAVCAEPERSAVRYGDRGRHLYCLQDTASAVTHILLAAVDMGLASCWVGAFDEEMAAEALSLPPNLRPVALLPIGYAAQSPNPRPRRSLAEVSRIV